jgi:hypothetical protein
MNWFLVLSLLFCTWFPAPVDAIEKPVVVQPKTVPRYQPYGGEMGSGFLKFLEGSWTYSDQNVIVLESWALDQNANVIGSRKRYLLLPEETDPPSEMYDFFAVHGGIMKMRRMDLFLHDVGTRATDVVYYSDYANKVTITVRKSASPYAPVMTMNYVSPNDDELDLEIITNENGKESKEAYKLKRIE